MVISISEKMAYIEAWPWKIIPADFTEIWVLGLTNWDRVMLKRVSKLTIIGSDNGLSPGQHQAIIWTIAGILLIGPSGTKFSKF